MSQYEQRRRLNVADVPTDATDIYGSSSVDFRDLMDLFGGLLANGYIPTDIFLHPLATDHLLLTRILTRPRYLTNLINEPESITIVQQFIQYARDHNLQYCWHITATRVTLVMPEDQQVDWTSISQRLDPPEERFELTLPRTWLTFRLAERIFDVDGWHLVMHRDSGQSSPT